MAVVSVPSLKVVLPKDLPTNVFVSLGLAAQVLWTVNMDRLVRNCSGMRERPRPTKTVLVANHSLR